MSSQSTSNNQVGGNGSVGNAPNNGMSTPAKMRAARFLLVVMALLGVLVSIYTNCEQYASSSAKARCADVEALLPRLQELDKSASSAFSDSSLLMLLPQPTDIIQQQIERPIHLSLTYNTRRDEQAERLRRSSEAYLMWVELAWAKENGQANLPSAMTARECYQRGSEMLNELVMPSMSTVVKERAKELTRQYERAEKLYETSHKVLQYMLAVIVVVLLAVSYMMFRLTGRTLNGGLVFGGLCVAYAFCADPLWLQVPVLLIATCSVSLAFRSRLAEYEFRGVRSSL